MILSIELDMLKKAPSTKSDGIKNVNFPNFTHKQSKHIPLYHYIPSKNAISIERI